MRRLFFARRVQYALYAPCGEKSYTQHGDKEGHPRAPVGSGNAFGSGGNLHVLWTGCCKERKVCSSGRFPTSAIFSPCYFKWTKHGGIGKRPEEHTLRSLHHGSLHHKS